MVSSSTAATALRSNYYDGCSRGEESSPLEAQESHEMHMPEVHGDPQTPSERPWWRRMFGG